jgi:acyl-homoserine lactone acylase PvdQ
MAWRNGLVMGVVAALAAAVSVSAQTSGHQATLYRDTYGVPHIYAQTPADGAYALGYAQAEDRLEDIYKNVRTALGTMSEAFGEAHVELDFILRMVHNAEVSESKYNEVPAQVRALAENYIAGVNAFIKERPERVPDYAIELKPWHCIAVGRTMILQWPLGTLKDELNRKSEKPAYFSNCWSVAPSRSAEKCPILLTDPHLTWQGLAVFYECRVHAGDFGMCGYCVVGSPLIALGHGANVGWACTTGGPDTSDVYALKLDPSMPTRYEYDGKWRYLDVRFIKIPVKGEAKPRVMPAMYSLHGPLLAEPDLKNNVAYAGKSNYLDDVGLMDQMYAMVTAKDADEFYHALGMNHMMEQNIMYADRNGTIGYVRTGNVPIRPDGYDWTKPVPGNTSATQWQGVHTVDDLVHIINPPQGYMQCCNTSPQYIMENSPLTPDKYKAYIYNALWDQDNPRGTRARELLAADPNVTKEKAIAVVMDVYDIHSKAWNAALKTALDAVGAERMKDAAFAETAKTVLAWNGEFDQNSVAAPIVEKLRRKCSGKVNIHAINSGEALPAAEQKTLVDLLGEAGEELKTQFGKTGATWGEVHQVGRDGQFYPYDGADLGGVSMDETITLRTVDSREEPKGSGHWIASGGSGSAMLMFMHPDGIESYSCIPWGQSAVPGSPHHTDQTRELYTKRQMKETWFAKDELLKHVESEKVLTIP